MLVYHTSDQCFVSPDVKHSREALDFGKGFYVTRLKAQAVKYANRFLRVGNDAFLHVFDYTPLYSRHLQQRASFTESCL